MTNHNKLLSYQEGCIGLKTGYTKAAGRTLVSCAEKGGQRLVAVTLQDGNDWADHQALFDYGFSTYPVHCVAATGEILAHLPVEGGVQNTVPLAAAERFSWPLAEEERLEIEICSDDPLLAPVMAGSKVGKAIFTVDGTEVGCIDLLCGRTVLPAAATAWQTLKFPVP